MTLTYIWWHQSHWSGTLCRCPSKFYCPQTVTWYSSGVPLEPLRWQGVCTVACLWQTGPEHLHLQTQESWCNDWPTKRRRRELYKHDFFFSGGQSLQAIAFYSNKKAFIDYCMVLEVYFLKSLCHTALFNGLEFNIWLNNQTIWSNSKGS